MTYRDDRDADQARIASLEAELAAERDKVAELEGRRSTALVVASKGALVPGGRPGAAQRLLGAPSRLAMERRFEGAYPIDKLEDLLETIRSVTRVQGRFELLRSSLTWWGAPLASGGSGVGTCVTVVVKDGVTTLAVTERILAVGALTLGMAGGFTGAAALPLLIVSTLMPVVVPVILLGWFGGTYAGTRALFKRTARKRAEAVQQLFDSLEREIAAALPAAS